MKRARRTLAGTAVAAALTAVGAGSTGSAVTTSTVSRWEVTAVVSNGYQHLSRLSNSSTPGHTGQGNLHSAWDARWRIKVKIIGPDVYIVGANAFDIDGNARGEYRGRYPKTQTETAHFTCPFHARAGKLLTRERIYGVGRTDSPFHTILGIHGEPGHLPRLKCSGDLVDRGTPSAFSGGVLTGIESGCYGDVVFPGKKLKQHRAFKVKKVFGWHPNTPFGESRSCSGFGEPIRSSGEGTIQLVFHPE